MNRLLNKKQSLFLKAQYLLEFDKVLSAISSFAVSEKAKNIILDLIFTELQLNPQTELYLTETTAQYLSSFNFSIDLYEPVENDLKQCKLPGSLISTEVVIKLRKLLRNNDLIRQLINDSCKANFGRLYEFVSLFPDLTEPDNLINVIFDADNLIKDSASPALKKVRVELFNLKRSIYSTFKRELEFYRSKLFLAEGEESIRNGRYVLRVQAEYKRQINGNLVGESDSGKTVFIEPQPCFELNNRLMELELDEQREIFKILQSLASQLLPYFDQFIELFNLICSLDILIAKARYANSINALLPNINQDQEFTLIEGYHPLLLNKLKLDGKSVVPLNLKISFQDRIILISGPNAGGKTIVLKTIGLLQIMLQRGLLIPVSRLSNFYLFKQVWVDIGDWQSIDEGLSTYSAKLKYMKRLVTEVQSPALVLMDELGSGTEPKIGGAIAESVLNELIQLKVFGIITTHYSNLKSFAHNQAGIQNASMLYDESLMKPLYQLVQGRPGSSYALDIAKKLNFPKRLIEYARRRAGKDLVRMEELIAKLEREKAVLEETVSQFQLKIDSLNKLIKAYEMMQKQYEIKRLKLKIDSKQIEFQRNHEQKQENKKILQEILSKLDFIEAKKRVEVSQIKEKEIAKELEHAEKEYFQMVQNAEPYQMIKPGDRVIMLKQGLSGEVVEIKNAKAKIITEKFTIELPENELRLEKESIFNVKKNSVNYQLVDMQSTIPGTIDLRGQNSMFALQALENYFDQILLSSLKEAKILHGKGSGKLKTSIHQYLKKLKFIESYYHPDEADGGVGVTIVRFN